MANSSDPAERLLNLVIALSNTRLAMSKRQIRQQVAGYSETADDAAFERTFERDKDTLRELGVPLVTVPDPVHGDEFGYRIDTEAYPLTPIAFTSGELGALAIASHMWRDQTLESAAERAITKLAAVGERAPEVAGGLEARLAAPDAAFDPLLRAIVHRRAVSFAYRTASSGQTGQRHLEPWRLRAQGRAWYVAGWDREKRAARVFRLSRFASPVTLEGPDAAFVRPPSADVDALFATDHAARPGQAFLALAPGRGELLRARATAQPHHVKLADEPAPGCGVVRPVGAMTHVGPIQDPATRDTPAPGYDMVHLDFPDIESMARELARLGDAVIVLDPPELRDAVIERLRAVLAAHGVGTGEVSDAG